jgi:hypothetical protein
MNNTWYYSEGDKSVGPLSLVDLTAVFSRVSEARDVLVWRNGLSSWVRAEDVPELAAHIVKPPPLIQKLEPAVPAMSVAARWGRGILYSSGAVLAVYLFDNYVSRLWRDGPLLPPEVYFPIFYAYIWGWLSGTAHVGVKRPKSTISARTIVAVLCVGVLAFLIYVAATQGTSSVLFRFSISFVVTLVAISLVGTAVRWINRQF